MTGIACQSDVNEDFRFVKLFGERKDANFTNKMDQYVKKSFSRWTKSIRERGNLSPAELSKIERIDIAVQPSRNVLGSAAGTSIILDEGNLLIGYAVSYANALFESRKLTLDEYDLWYQYFIDAIVDGDPIVYPFGVQDFMQFIQSTGGLDETIRTSFLINLNSWTALTVFHEVAHVVSNHASKLQSRFPTLAQRPISEWTAEEYEYSRNIEREADKRALDLFMNAAGFDPKRGLTYWVLLPVLRREVIVQVRGLTIYPTHPDPRERAAEFMSHFFELQGLDRTDQNDMLVQLEELIRDFVRRIRGNRRPIDHIPVDVPPETPADLRRFFKRDCHLRQLPRLRSDRTKTLTGCRIEPGHWMEIEM